ncbi:MgtC/SapB family protein [Candidatus Woesearchaeota archaeon]|nr:MgtC/SapB family protein [Candidatus Woesearchaeota archaeon]
MIGEYEVVVRSLLALVAGALIGLEREKTRHSAGIRTHMLVCVGSALITLTSIEMFPEDSARIAAGIVTGIGFLGAGTIFRDKSNVKGLTTAASIWAVAGMGIALGAGAYFIALVSAAALLVTLEFGRLERIFIKRRK